MRIAVPLTSRPTKLMATSQCVVLTTPEWTRSRAAITVPLSALSGVDPRLARLGCSLRSSTSVRHGVDQVVDRNFVSLTSKWLWVTRVIGLLPAFAVVDVVRDEDHPAALVVADAAPMRCYAIA